MIGSRIPNERQLALDIKESEWQCFQCRWKLHSTLKAWISRYSVPSTSVDKKGTHPFEITACRPCLVLNENKIIFNGRWVWWDRWTGQILIIEQDVQVRKYKYLQISCIGFTETPNLTWYVWTVFTRGCIKQEGKDVNQKSMSTCEITPFPWDGTRILITELFDIVIECIVSVDFQWKKFQFNSENLWLERIREERFY